MKKKYNWFNFKSNWETRVTGVSVTEPDRVMSITEIMTRFARGQPLGGRTDVWYDEDNEYDDQRDYDLTELAEMREEHKSNYERFKKDKEKQDAEKRAKWQDEQFYSRLKNEGYEKSIPQKKGPDV